MSCAVAEAHATHDRSRDSMPHARAHTLAYPHSALPPRTHAQRGSRSRSRTRAQFAYNVERMIYLVSGGDVQATGRYMRAAQARRPERLPPELLARIQAVFLSCAVDDAQTCATMAAVHRESGGLVLDPHSAVGVHAARDPAVRTALRAEAGRAGAPPVCVVLTAHPAKFEDACVRAGVPVPKSDKVERLRSVRHSFEWLRAPPAGTNKLEAWAAQLKRAVEAAAAQRRRPASKL